MTGKEYIEYYVWLLGEYKKFEKLVKHVIDVKQGINSYNLIIDFDAYYEDEPVINITYDYDECAWNGKYVRNSCCAFPLKELSCTDGELVKSEKENEENLINFVKGLILKQQLNPKKD